MTNKPGHSLHILLLLIFTAVIPATDVSAVELCPFVDEANGAIAADTDYSSETDFSAALLGTFDRLDTGNIFGGMDWLYSDAGAFSTTSIGGQLIAMWILKGGRSTELQVTNQSLSSSVSLHVQIFDENCVEIVDFCDSYTPEDTHTYDMANLVRNTGTTITVEDLTGREGFVAVTPNVNCGTDFRAIAFPQLSGDMRINGPQGYQYGAKMWARDTGTLFDCASTTDSGFKILDGVGDCGFETVLPSRFSGVFSTLPGADASRADLVFINISDVYTPSSYIPFGGSVVLEPLMFDLNEVVQSCPPLNACYKRVGLNSEVPLSDTLLLPGPPPGVPGEPPFDPPGSPPAVPGGPPFDPPGPPPAKPPKP